MENFNSNVIEWVNLDNNIIEYNNKTKSLKKNKSLLEKKIIEHINENELSDNIINISSLNTKIQLHKNNINEGITFKFLENTFLKYFQETSDNKLQTKNLLDFIKKSRETNEKYSLKRN